jgi:hypothetical protein
MPSHDRLAASLGIVVVAIDQDGAATVGPFLRKHALTHLSIGLDPGQHVGSLNTDEVSAAALPLWGLPITYLIDNTAESSATSRGPPNGTRRKRRN